MTTEQKFIEMLYSYGVSKQDASAIMAQARTEIDAWSADNADGYKTSWDSGADGYPQQFYKVLFNQIKPIADKWAESNRPLAWWRGMMR